MRKILLGTTAVVGAALISATAMAQEAPTVRVTGYFDFSMGYVNDNADRNQAARTGGGFTNRDKIDFRSDAEVAVSVTGKAANGLSYGALIEFQVDNVLTGNGGAVDTDEMYLFVASPTLGRLTFGDEDSAANLMMVRAPTIYAAGSAGRWTDFVQHNGASRYLVTSINDGGDRTKIIYTSPQFFGFDFGLSYSPNAGEGEAERLSFTRNTAGFLNAGSAAAPIAMQRDGTTVRNEITGAVRYRGSFGNVGVQLGAGFTRGDAPLNAAAGTRDPNAYTVGAAVTAFGFSLGAEYLWGRHVIGSAGNTGLASGRDNSSSWVLGATYTAGALQLGAFYARGEGDTSTAFIGDRTQTVWGLGAVYTIAPGLTGFANYTNVSDRNLEANTGARLAGQSRSMDVFIVGTALTF